MLLTITLPHSPERHQDQLIHLTNLSFFPLLLLPAHGCSGLELEDSYQLSPDDVMLIPQMLCWWALTSQPQTLLQWKMPFLLLH